MKKLPSFIKYLFVVFLCFISIFSIRNVTADSGWDSSYDSGSSSWSDSSSSWGSSDSDSSSGSILPRNVKYVIDTVLCLIAFLSLCWLVVSEIKQALLTSFFPRPIITTDVLEENLKNILPGETVDSLKKIAYQKFVEIQNAWMNFDYESLRELCTDELYNSYKSQLEVLKLKNGQNIMNNFELLNTSIYDVVEINGEIIVRVYMCIQFYDYVIDTNSKKVIRGTKDMKICNNYLMEFVRKQKVDDKEVYCSNCGALIKNNTSGECEYCGSTIVKSANDYVLSRKVNINKR